MSSVSSLLSIFYLFIRNLKILAAMSKTSTVIVSGRTFTISNFGPLTTIFAPPRECYASWYETNLSLELGMELKTTCLPPGFSNRSPNAGYYSPGLCPASYTQAKPLSSWWLTPGETGVHCCPTSVSPPPHAKYPCS